MQVKFKYKDGRERAMTRRDADILQKLGRGTYLARDMQAIKPAAPAADAEPPKPSRKKKSKDEE